MARSGERRPWSVVMFGLTLAASVYSHSYGVLLFVPFVLTELALGVVEKRWDRQICLAIVLAGVALLPLMPFMLAVGGNTAMFSDPSLTAVQGLYGRLLGFPSAIFLLLTLGAGLLASNRPASPVLSGRSPTILASRAGTFFLLTFCLLPAAGFFMARLATNAYADRYFVFAVVGFSIAFALMVHQQWRAQSSWLAVWCLLGLVLLATLEIRHHYTVPTYRAGNSVTAAAAVEATRRLPGGNEPLLVSSVFYMPVYYYSAPEVRQRLYFLDEDPTSHFSIAAGRLAAIKPLAIISLADLLEKHSRFYIYMPSDRLMREARRRSMQVSYIDGGLYYVAPRVE
jgi:hypothetical protein